MAVVDMDSSEKFCIFCRKIVMKNDLQMRKDIIREILVVLLPKSNFDFSNPLICHNCLKRTLAAFQFKSICLYTEDDIFPYMDGTEAAQLDLKEIYMQVKKKKKKPINVHENVCRLCMQLVTCQVIPLFDMEIDVLKEFLPEMNFNIIKNPVVCKSCYDSFASHTKFLRCLGVEIKVENLKVKQESYTSPCDFYIKTEDIDIPIKYEHDCDENVLSTNQVKSGFKDAPNDNSVFLDIKRETSSNITLFQKLPKKTEWTPHFMNHQLVQKDPLEMQMYKSDTCIFETKYIQAIPRQPSEQSFECKTEYPNSSGIHQGEDDKSVLKEHLLKQSDLRIYECDKCEYKTKKQSHLKMHEVVHKDPSEVEMYKCNVCEYKTKHRRNLLVHLGKHDNSKLNAYKCDECSYVARFKYALKKHQIKHSNVRIYECDNCEYKGKTEYCLKRHKSIHKKYKFQIKHSNLRIYACDLCEYKAKTQYYLTCHKVIHKDPSEVKLYKCNVCEYKTKHRGNLWSHVGKHDKLKLNAYKCDKCSYSTRFRARLKKHQMKHSDVRIYECDRCEYKAKTQNCLTCHKWIHEDPSDILKCDMCEYKTKYKRNLWNHKSKHNKSQLNKYKCDQCSYATRFMCLLKNHQISHSDVRKYECDKCEYKAKRLSHLTTHKLKHKDPSEVRMYKCTVCEFQSKLKCTVDTHQSKHSQIVEKCILCDYKTKWKRSLRRHMLTHVDVSQAK